jgi:hypothetical protein
MLRAVRVYLGKRQCDVGHQTSVADVERPGADLHCSTVAKFAAAMGHPDVRTFYTLASLLTLAQDHGGAEAVACLLGVLDDASAKVLPCQRPDQPVLCDCHHCVLSMEVKRARSRADEVASEGSATVRGYPKALRMARAARAMTLAEVGAAASVDGSYVSLLESGKREASPAVLAGLARAFGLTPEQLADLASEPSQVPPARLVGVLQALADGAP